MPAKVKRCFNKLRKKMGDKAAAGTCVKATGQKLGKHKKPKKRRKK